LTAAHPLRHAHARHRRRLDTRKAKRGLVEPNLLDKPAQTRAGTHIAPPAVVMLPERHHPGTLRPQFEAGVVVAPLAADLLHPVKPAGVVHHLVKQRRGNFENWAVEKFSGDRDLVDSREAVSPPRMPAISPIPTERPPSTTCLHHNPWCGVTRKIEKRRRSL